MSIDAARIILRNFPFIEVVKDTSQQVITTVFATEKSDSLSDNIPTIGLTFIGLPFSPFPENETIDVEFIKTDGTLSEIKCPCLDISENSEISLVSYERYKWWKELQIENDDTVLALLITKKKNGLIYAKKILFLSERFSLSHIRNTRTFSIDSLKNKFFGTQNSLLSSIYS